MKILYSSAILLLIGASASAQTTQRLPLVEGLSSATCPPCASWNNAYTPVLNNNAPNEETNPGVAVLKYQMNWPGAGNDPSYNDDADSRRGFYGTTGIPDWYIDGEINNGTQGEIDTRAGVPAELEIEAAYTLTGQDLDITVRFTPLNSLGNGSRLYVALANGLYNYNGSNGETEFHHVLRKMISGTNGEFVPNMQTGQTQVFNYQYTYTVASGTPAQMSEDLWNNDFEIVAWVQRATGTKEVWNATVVYDGVLGVPEGDRDDFGLQVYPNPATGETAMVMFQADNDEDAIIGVYNNMGQKVQEINHGRLAGMQRVEISTAELAGGMYYVKVQQGQQVATNPLIINK